MPIRGPAAIASVRHGPERALEAQRRRRVAQVGAGPGPVEPERGADEPRAAREARVGQALEARGLARDRVRARSTVDAPPARPADRRASVDALERLDGADEHRAGGPGRAGDHVQAVVHPVDKVHVGDARRPEHDRVAGRPPEAGVRRPVLGAVVGLDLDDPARAPARASSRTRRGAEERAGGVDRRPVQRRAVDRARSSRRSSQSGTRKPETAKNAGMTVSRKIAAAFEPIDRRPELAQERELLRVGGDAGDGEERVEDDQDGAEDQGGLDEAEDAADQLVDEARLLEQRLRLVEALGDDRERDRRREEDRPEPDHRAYSGENCVQFCPR